MAHQRSYVGLILGFGVAIVLLSFAALRRPAQIPDPPVDAASSEPSVVPMQSKLRQSTTALPPAPVPTTAEQLQQETETTLQELVSRYPTMPEALHVAAMGNSQLRHTAEAEHLWTKCIELAPQDERYYVNLAAVAIDRGNSELAVEILDKGQALGHDSPDLLYHAAVALTNLGEFKKAEEAARKALASLPESADHWLVLGQTQLKDGRYPEAESSLRRAIELGAQSPSVYFAVGNACARQGKQSEAAEFLEKYKSLKTPRDLDKQQRFAILSLEDAQRTAVVVLTEAAIVHAKQQDTMEAERLLLRAIAINPSSVASYSTLAALYRTAGMVAEERAVRMQLTAIVPHDFGNVVELARVCSELGEPESAEAVMKLAISANPQNPVAFAMLAEFHLAAGRADKARWYAQESVRRRPTAEAYRLLSSTCKALGDDETAEAAFQMARKIEADAAPKNEILPNTK